MLLISLLNLIEKDHETITRLEQYLDVHNLTDHEEKTLLQLWNNTRIIIKPADKESTTFVMDRIDYVQEGTTQLNDPTYYRSLREPFWTHKDKYQISGILCIKINS